MVSRDLRCHPDEAVEMELHFRYLVGAVAHAPEKPLPHNSP